MYHAVVTPKEGETMKKNAKSCKIVRKICANCFADVDFTA